MVLQRTHPTSPPTSTENTEKNMLKELLLTILRDIFQFYDSMYRQIKGVAIGTRCTPPFANIFVGTLEENALSNWKNKGEQNHFSGVESWMTY